MYSNDMNLSLNGDTFSILKEQYDGVINRTLGNMEMKGAEEATITVKVGIKLERTTVGNRTIVRPTFKHDISSVMQVKDKVSGELVGDYQLVWDDDEQKYIMRKIESGQTSLFDNESNGAVVEADYQTVEELPEGKSSLPGLPEPTVDAGAEGKPRSTGDAEGGEPDPAKESESVSDGGGDDEAPAAKDNRYDEKTPFGWMAQFVGEEMRVTEAMGNYTVRTTANEVVLSSATDPSNPFYCDGDKLAEHVGHNLICAGYGKEDLVVVSIQCSDCASALFTLIAPGATEEEVNEAMKDEEESAGEEPSDGGSYEYDPPEE